MPLHISLVMVMECTKELRLSGFEKRILCLAYPLISNFGAILMNLLSHGQNVKVVFSPSEGLVIPTYKMAKDCGKINLISVDSSQ